MDKSKSSPDPRPKSRLQIRLPSKQTNAVQNERPSSTPKQPQQQPPQKPQQQQQQQKPWPKYSPKPPNVKAPFARTDQIHLHHQSSSLHFVYHNGKWSYQGETTLYLSHVPEPDETKANTNSAATNVAATTMREIALHFRGGDRMHVTRATVHVPLPETRRTNTGGVNQTQNNISLTPIRADVIHHDPLSKVLTKPAQSFTPKEFYPPALGVRTNKASKSSSSAPGRRYEADTQCTRGGSGMMDALRCASIASSFGEMRLRFICPRSNVAGKEVLMDVWREDLVKMNGSGSGSDAGSGSGSEAGSLGDELKCADYKRGRSRRENRLDLIVNQMVQEKLMDKNSVSSLGGASSAKNRETKDAGGKAAAAVKASIPTFAASATMGLKVVIQFCMEEVESVHLGGIHFQAPTLIHDNPQLQTSTPHVYTTSGVIGDHQGVRSWVPTIDSASSKHRSSHELTIAVTADSREGLWAAGCGEHFGVCKTVLHSVPRCNRTVASNQNTIVPGSDSGPGPGPAVVNFESAPLGPDRAEKELKSVLGKRNADFIVKRFKETQTNNNLNMVTEEDKVHVIPPENASETLKSYRGPLATAMWTTSIWSPCPSRSLSFAIGPFCVMYDPEYYGKEEKDNDDDDGQESDDEEEEDEDYPTISETAKKHGEGIRQLYFALKGERQYIHSNATIVGDNVAAIRYAPFNLSDSEINKSMIMAIMGSTAGVPNRALSLMRDILSLPSYRTMSYSQIWIPDAVDGGVSSGTFHACPEVSCNSFLGGAILDSKLLHPVGQRLPFYAGGRVLQFAQARCAIRGWISAALPLGGSDDVGHSYLHPLIESFIMSLYERAHGAFGEGGSRHSFLFSKRYAVSSGLNSKNMDFLPVTNVEEEDIAFAMGPGFGAVGALPADERGKEQLWRNAENGEESHTSTLDEFSIRQLLSKDFLEGIERVDKSLPSMGWLGSLLSMTYLTSNSTSSSRVGCGAVELLHPVGGTVYRHLKCKSLSKIIEARSGLSNFVRVVRAAFIAAILEDKGVTQVDLPHEKPTKVKESRDSNNVPEKAKPLFILCVNELVKKGGLAHGSFIRALRVLSGIREPYLRGDLIDCSRKARGTIPSQPEGFPNSFVRGSCGLYLRVGVHVESAALGDQQNVKNLQAHVLAEPVIPEKGIAFGGPVTVRIIERGGQCREFVKVIESDGSRSDWGPITLYGDPVASVKSQVAASGTIESAQSAKKGASGRTAEEKNSLEVKKKSLFGPLAIVNKTAFDENLLHRGGYQALELIRLTNRTPLLWIRVDPHGVFDGRVALFQQDACLGEQLFHDGDALSQVEALRALAERPLRLQGAPKVKSLYDVPVEELPVHLLGDCLRGSVALHADLPHNPAIRAQAALAIAQWQNNKAPLTKNSVGWVGLQLLVQYFNERFYKNGSITCAKFSRVCLKSVKGSQTNSTNTNSHTTESDQYHYLDFFDEDDRLSAIEQAHSTEREEDEEYRVRSAVVTAITSIRAKDGLSPPLVLDVLKKILQAVDESGPMPLQSIEEERSIRNKKQRKKSDEDSSNSLPSDNLVQHLFQDIEDIPYSSSSLIADALLALCHINARPDLVDDPVTGKQIQSTADHPCVPLMESCLRWLQWDLYKETIHIESQMKQLSPIGRISAIAPCAITALYSLALLRQSTTDSAVDWAAKNGGSSAQKRKREETTKLIETASTTDFYIKIFDARPLRPDSTRAAAAQAVLCLCCAGDRNNADEPVGLLAGLEFVLERMLEPTTSPGLRQTLALLMMDASTGKICSTQRIAMIAKSNDLVECGTRIYNGPLGASYGSENGASIHTTVAAQSMPAADAVNNGARRGLRLIKQAGKTDVARNSTIVRVATFATNLWRTINGELGGESQSSNVDGITPITSAVDGICAHDGYLRCSLLSLWQWLWPKACIAVLRIQHEGTGKYLGADEVMRIDESEKEAATVEDSSCTDLRTITAYEIDRQRWRGEMAGVRRKEVASSKDASASSQGLNFPLRTVSKDEAWRQGGWVASASSQRRKEGSDGGSSVSVTKLRLSVSGRD